MIRQPMSFSISLPQIVVVLRHAGEVDMRKEWRYHVHGPASIARQRERFLNVSVGDKGNRRLSIAKCRGGSTQSACEWRNDHQLGTSAPLRCTQARLSIAYRIQWVVASNT